MPAPAAPKIHAHENPTERWYMLLAVGFFSPIGFLPPIFFFSQAESTSASESGAAS
jgi:hypothetical protein